MKRFILFSFAIIFCMILQGCVYSSANLLRAQGKEINVLGAWGWVKCVDASVTMYRSTDSMSYLKDKDAKYPKIPPRPTIQEEAESSSFNVGKPAKMTPKEATPAIDTTPIAEVAKGLIEK